MIGSHQLPKEPFCRGNVASGAKHKLDGITRRVDDWKGQGRSFEQVAGFATGGALLVTGEEAERVRGTSVTEDFFTLFRTPALLGAIALLACLLPARRATRVDPLIALRAE